MLYNLIVFLVRECAFSTEIGVHLHLTYDSTFVVSIVSKLFFDLTRAQIFYKL